MNKRDIGAGLTAASFILAIGLIASGLPSCKDRGSGQAPDPRLAGTWRQEMSGGRDVSDLNVELVFSGTVAAMKAPGCTIRGEYATSGDTLTLTITSTEGPRCAPGQETGVTESSHYSVTPVLLTLMAKGAGGDKVQLFRKADAPSGRRGAAR